MSIIFLDDADRVDILPPDRAWPLPSGQRIHSRYRMAEGRVSDAADEIAENRASLECAFDMAISYGASAILPVPKDHGPGGSMTFAEALSAYCDDDQMLALVLAAARGEDVQAHAQLLLSVVRENYVDAFEDVL